MGGGHRPQSPAAPVSPPPLGRSPLPFRCWGHGEGGPCPAVLGTRTQNQGLGRSQPTMDCGADHSSPVPLWERGPLCPVQDFELSWGWGPPRPHLGFLGAETDLAPSRFLGGADRPGSAWLSRGCGALRPARPHLGVSGVEPLRAARLSWVPGRPPSPHPSSGFSSPKDTHNCTASLLRSPGDRLDLGP